jgi:hypothetical protein
MVMFCDIPWRLKKISPKRQSNLFIVNGFCGGKDI